MLILPNYRNAMTSMTSFTMYRVLEIPELLDMVFKYLDLPSNASNARVCKKWSEMALDVLWRNVDDLPRLFSILVPLRLMNDNEYVSIVSFYSFSLTYCSRCLTGFRILVIGCVLNVIDGGSAVCPTKVSKHLASSIKVFSTISLERGQIWISFQACILWSGMHHYLSVSCSCTVM